MFLISENKGIKLGIQKYVNFVHFLNRNLTKRQKGIVENCDSGLYFIMPLFI